MSKKRINRRGFMKKVGCGILLAPAAGILVQGTPVLAQDKLISLDDATAKALGYVHDKSKADTAKYPKLKTPEGAKQNCANCMQFTSTSGDLGKCTILPAGLVKSGGWCSVWVAKPAK